jgi:hypothetical protein
VVWTGVLCLMMGTSEEECSGVEWSGVEWSGVEWSGVELNLRSTVSWLVGLGVGGPMTRFYIFFSFHVGRPL